MKKLKILYLITEDWYFWSHRRGLASAALERGFIVTLVTRVHDKNEEIKHLGINLVPSMMKRSSFNLFYEVKTIIELIRIYRDEKPDIVHHVALKPVLYGTLAAKITGVESVVNALGGLGHLYSSPKLIIKVIRRFLNLLLRIAFSGRNSRLILQNSDDREYIIKNKISSADKIKLIKGSGADLGYFQYGPEPQGIPLIMYAGRLLWSKGVAELIDAVGILIQKHILIKAVIVGIPDSENPESINLSAIKAWEELDYVEWWGFQENMAEILTKATIVVLPTRLREGVPKVLIEAAAVGRPLIASNLPGCRDIVKDHWNGLLVPPNDPEQLANAIEMILMNKQLRNRMGKNSRKLAEEEFSEEIVNKKTFEIYDEIRME